PIHARGRETLAANPDIDFSIHEKIPADEFKALLADADGLILRLTPLGKDLIDAAPKLRIVSRYGVGYDHVDVAALTERGIPLAICGDALSVGVAEHTLYLMLGISRNGAFMDRA